MSEFMRSEGSEARTRKIEGERPQSNGHHDLLDTLRLRPAAAWRAASGEEALGSKADRGASGCGFFACERGVGAGRHRVRQPWPAIPVSEGEAVAAPIPRSGGLDRGWGCVALPPNLGVRAWRRPLGRYPAFLRGCYRSS